MTPAHHQRGGAAVAVLTHMDVWEAGLILNLRLWCAGPAGQGQVRADYDRALPVAEADRAWHAFDRLVRTLVATATRPMVRHDLGCTCAGSDECVFAHLVRTASDGHLNDAALIATLLTGPAHAEHIAVLAGEVGTCLRRIHAQPTEPAIPARAVVRMH